jgi:hypothetical protein
MERWFRWRRQTTLSCEEVAAVLQSYVDGEIDDVTTARVRRHLVDCLRCGMEEATFLALKASLARRSPLDDDALTRIRTFADGLGRRLSDDEGAAG